MSAGEARKAPAAGRKWAARVGWFVLLWCAGVAALAGVAWLIRMALPE